MAVAISRRRPGRPSTCGVPWCQRMRGARRSSPARTPSSGWTGGISGRSRAGGSCHYRAVSESAELSDGARAHPLRAAARRGAGLVLGAAGGLGRCAPWRHARLLGRRLSVCSVQRDGRARGRLDAGCRLRRRRGEWLRSVRALVHTPGLWAWPHACRPALGAPRRRRHALARLLCAGAHRTRPPPYTAGHCHILCAGADYTRYAEAYTLHGRCGSGTAAKRREAAAFGCSDGGARALQRPAGLVERGESLFVADAGAA